MIFWIWLAVKVLIPVAIALTARWLGGRRRQRVQQGGTVRLDARLNADKGELLVDGAAGTLAFQRPGAAPVPITPGGVLEDVTVARSYVGEAFADGADDRRLLHYRDPDGQLLVLSLPRHDAVTVRSLLGARVNTPVVEPTFASLAEAAGYADRFRPRNAVGRPKRTSGTVPRRSSWLLVEVLGTFAWFALGLAGYLWATAQGSTLRLATAVICAVAGLARLGWFVTNGWLRTRIVRRTLARAEPRPLHYVRFERGRQEHPVLLLFPSDSDDARPEYLQAIYVTHGSRRTVGLPAPSGTALVRSALDEEDPRDRTLACEIDGLTYLPHGPARVPTPEEVLALAHAIRPYPGHD